jgi:hypothetical protein
MLNHRPADLVVPKFELLTAPEDIAIRNRGLQALSDHVNTLADFASFSMQASEPSYRRSHRELQLAMSALRIMEACRLPVDDRAGTTDWPSRIGRRRAQQGVPPDALCRAYHIGGQVLFNAFIEWAAGEELPRERSLAMANDLWNVFDLHYAAANTALRDAEDELFGGRRAGELLDSLLDGDADRESVDAVMRAWGWAERARYVVVVQRPADWGAPPLALAELPAKVEGVRVVWRVRGGGAIGVAALGDMQVTTFTRALPARPSRRTGVSLAVEGLAELGRARRLAELAARTVTVNHNVVCLEERLPAALLASRPDLARELSTRVLGPVLALDRVSRDLLLDTYSAWLAGGGSAQNAATSLFCHRNTVLNRLRRLERLTGRSLAVPHDIVALTLALEEFGMRTARA